MLTLGILRLTIWLTVSSICGAGEEAVQVEFLAEANVCLEVTVGFGC